MTTTSEVLAEMLTENTGIQMCDSGGENGRMWQRNAGLTTQDFVNEPDAQIRGYEGVFNYVVVSTFHYLHERLDYADGLTQEFMEFAEQEENKNVPWLALMEEFAYNEYNSETPMTFNSYNSENLLSQTIQGVVFDYGDQPYVLLQVHGGADVRGGYTAPRVFKMMENDRYSIFYNWNSYFLTTESGALNHYFRDGAWVKMNEDWSPCDEPDTDSIIQKDGEWIWEPTGEEITVFADNDI